MQLPSIEIRTAITKCRDMCDGEDFYSFGPDVFLNSQSANTIVEINVGDGKLIYVFDVKTPGYPPKKFINSYHLMGGSWIDPNHPTPFDVLKNELNEEIEKPKLIEALIDDTSPFGDYMIVVPRDVHGNDKHKAKLFISFSSIFLSKITKGEIESIFNISLEGSHKNIVRLLQSVLEPIFNETKPGIVFLDDLIHGKCKKFSWGHNKILSDYFLQEYNIKVGLPGFEKIIVERLASSPVEPYHNRAETKHNRLNPLKRGITSDALAYETEKVD